MAIDNKSWFRVRMNREDIGLIMGVAQVEGVTASEWVRKKLAEAVAKLGGPEKVPVVSRVKRERVASVAERLGRKPVTMVRDESDEEDERVLIPFEDI